jgi:probable rRNA maturation factor
VITVEVNNQHPTTAIDNDRLSQAALAVLKGEGVLAALLSLAVVDDSTIHVLNQRYLRHDYPTDVLSFPLELRLPHYLEGEVVVSADRAEQVGPQHGWAFEDELLLYVIHGVLHLTGYDDHSDEDRERMRARERFYLDQVGVRAEI